jgi:flagellar secretion chaperone FliS
MRRLFEANMRKQAEPVIEVERLVREIRDAWAQMLSKRDATMDRGSRAVA